MIKTPAKSSFRVKHIPSYFFISAATYISNNSCSAFGSTSFFTRISSKSMSQSSSTPTDGFSFTQWSPEARNVINENCIPPLTAESYKGSSGRVGVLGGSAQYTGAPYYAAMSALNTGIDLAFVLCAEEAAVAIKCYSPELMVAPVYCAKSFDEVSNDVSGDEETKSKRELLVTNMVQKVSDLLPKIHCLIIGPGLGRCPVVFEATARIIKLAIENDVSMVIDADALFLLSLEKYRNLLKNFGGDEKGSQIILTPNIVEYERLVNAFASTNVDEDNCNNDIFIGTSLEGSIIIRKGQCDSIFRVALPPTRNIMCADEGGLKRSGGIGDVLSGSVGAFLTWHQLLKRRPDRNVGTAELLQSCWAACCLTKRATRHAFYSKKRAMSAADIIDHIGDTFDEMFG